LHSTYQIFIKLFITISEQSKYLLPESFCQNQIDTQNVENYCRYILNVFTNAL